MEVIIKSTDKFTNVDGVDCRYWEGTTADGVPCHVFIHRIAAANVEDRDQFNAELREIAMRSRVVELRNIL